MEKCVFVVKFGKAWRTCPRLAVLFRSLFGAVMFMSERWTIEFR